MANIQHFISFLFKWEGGTANDPDDAGGLTHMGVTYRTWLRYGIDLDGNGRIDEKDLVRITQQDVVRLVLKPHYWDACRADEIDNQAVANLLVDWYWCSGLQAIRNLQRILHLNCDGIVGKLTLLSINHYPDPKELFRQMKQARIDYLQRICELRPRNRKFYRGWINRLNDLKEE